MWPNRHEIIEILSSECEEETEEESPSEEESPPPSPQPSSNNEESETTTNPSTSGSYDSDYDILESRPHTPPPSSHVRTEYGDSDETGSERITDLSSIPEHERCFVIQVEAAYGDGRQGPMVSSYTSTSLFFYEKVH